MHQLYLFESLEANLRGDLRHVDDLDHIVLVFDHHSLPEVCIALVIAQPSRATHHHLALGLFGRV